MLRTCDNRATRCGAEALNHSPLPRGARRPAGPPHLGGEVWRQLGSHGVVPAVDVHQLAGGHVEVVGKQGHDCAADRGPVLKVPAQWCTHAPYLFEILESRYPTCSQRGKRTCAHSVDSDLVTAEIAREITSHRLER